MNTIPYLIAALVCAVLIGRLTTVFLPCRLPEITKALFGSDDEEDEFDGEQEVHP